MAQNNDLFPSSRPTTTTDPWQCATENLDQYFSMPTPTGDLSTALLSYGSELIKTCTTPGCPYPARSSWCDFSKAAPTSVLPAWTSLGSAASSWWSENKQSASSLAEKCPYGWYDAAIGSLNGQIRLNNTITWGACYAEAQVSVQSSSDVPTATAMPKSPVVGTTPSPPTSTRASSETESVVETDTPRSGGMRRVSFAESWPAQCAGTMLIVVVLAHCQY